jgi:hypothetical protein
MLIFMSLVSRQHTLFVAWEGLIISVASSEGWNKTGAYKNTFLLNNIFLVDVSMVEVSETCH